MSYIYVITNDINGKQYVGKTNWTIEKRFREHIKDRKYRKCEKRPLYSAMNKYGIEHFSVKQLEECNESIVNEREQYWINKLNTYHNGYNATLGGDSKHYYNYQEIANKYLELQSQKETAKYFNCDIHTVRVACKQCNISTLPLNEVIKKTHGKKVAMIDKDTNIIIQYFDCATDGGRYIHQIGASTSNNIKGITAHICRTCRGESKTAFGYKWKYIGD